MRNKMNWTIYSEMKVVYDRLSDRRTKIGDELLLGWIDGIFSSLFTPLQRKDAKRLSASFRCKNCLVVT